MKIIILTLLSLTLFVSCATDVANRYYASQTYPAKSVEEVEVHFKRPNKDFEVIAEFQSRGESTNSFRKKAANIGADAIIIQNLGGYASLSSNWAGDDPHSNSHSRRVGIAIKYK